MTAAAGIPTACVATLKNVLAEGSLNGEPLEGGPGEDRRRDPPRFREP
jgi:hypothetical protein